MHLRLPGLSERSRAVSRRVVRWVIIVAVLLLVGVITRDVATDAARLLTIGPVSSGGSGSGGLENRAGPCEVPNEATGEVANVAVAEPTGEVAKDAVAEPTGEVAKDAVAEPTGEVADVAVGEATGEAAGGTDGTTNDVSKDPAGSDGWDDAAAPGNGTLGSCYLPR
jgi:hypothetical protein